MVDANCRLPLTKALPWHNIYHHGSEHSGYDNFGIVMEHFYDSTSMTIWILVIKSSWMYMHDRKRDLLWQTRIITEEYFFVVHVPMTMRLCNSRLPEEHFVCYQTSQCNWVIIKVLYRCLRRYLLGWRISRLGFVTPIVGEVSLALSVMHIVISLASNVTNELVTDDALRNE